jgi:hypothetical protein
VNRVRDQSHEQPIARSCSRMVEPVSVDELPHALDERLAPQVLARLPLRCELPLDHVLRRDAGVVRARQVERSRPCIRRQRISTSWIVLLRPCPMWSTAVTFGGGITMTYGSAAPLSTRSASCMEVAALLPFAVERRLDVQDSYCAESGSDIHSLVQRVHPIRLASTARGPPRGASRSRASRDDRGRGWRVRPLATRAVLRQPLLLGHRHQPVDHGPHAR